MNKEVDAARQGLSDAETGGAITEGFLAPGMGEYVLLPGNPNRITLMAGQWDAGSAKEYDLNRVFLSPPCPPAWAVPTWSSP